MRLHKWVLELIAREKWYIAFFVLLLLSFNLNIFGLGLRNDWFESFEKHSSAIVEKTVECKGIIDNYSGPITNNQHYKYNEVMYKHGCDSKEYAPYVSQFGLQARVLAFLSTRTDHYKQFLQQVEFLLAGVFAFLLTVLVRKIYKQFGLSGAIGIAVGIIITPWLAGFSHNLYWVVFVLFLPFLFSFLFYESLRNQKKLPWFYGLITILFFLKFLNGYEYASTMVFSVLSVIAYYELPSLNWKQLRMIWKKAVLILLSSVMAIVAAIAINVASLKEYAGGVSEAYTLVIGRAEDRASITHYQKDVIRKIRNTTPAIYAMIDSVYDLDQLEEGNANPLKYIMISAINYAMLPAISLPFVMREPLMTIIQSILMVSLLGGIAIRYLKNHSKQQQLPSINKISVLYWLGLVGALSWLVLMPGHTYVHPHINALVFYLPFLLVSFTAIGMAVEIFARKRLRAR